MPMVRAGRERPGVPHARRRRSTRSSPTSRIATSAASRCSSARRRSRTPRCCRAIFENEQLPHEVLNAKQHAREAEIVAQAGRPKRRSRSRPTWRAAAPTSCWAERSSRQILKLRDDRGARADRQGSADRRRCAANGRCATTRSIASGGLHIVGTERHESRRIDNQLRGRAGPPGRPGQRRASTCRSRTRCCASSAASASASIMQKLKMPEGEPIEHPIVNRSIAKAQNARRVAQLRHPEAAARIRRRRERPAARDLPAAQRARSSRATSPDTIRNMIVRTDRRHGAAVSSRRSRSRSSGTSPGLETALAAEFQMQAPVGEWLKADPEITDENAARRG